MVTLHLQKEKYKLNPNICIFCMRESSCLNDQSKDIGKENIPALIPINSKTLD